MPQKGLINEDEEQRIEQMSTIIKTERDLKFEDRPTYDEKNPNYRSQIQRENPIFYLFFMFVLRLVKKSFFLSRKGKELEPEDALGIPWKYRGEILGQRITNILEDQKRKNPNKPANLFTAILRAMGVEIFVAHALELALMLLRIITVYFIYKIIKALVNPDIPNYMAYVWAGILAGTFIIAFITEHHAFHQKFLVPMYLKGALSSILYKKIGKLSVYSLNKISTGKLINIVTNDMNMFEIIGEYFADVIVGFLGLIASTALLWHFFNVTVLVGIGYMVLTFPIQAIITNLSMKPRIALSKATDERVKVTSEVIDGIRLIKMYTWELVFRDKIKKLRETEVKYLRQVRNYDSLARAISFSAQVVAPFLIFLTYNLTGNALETATVFPAYFLLGFVRIFSVFLFTLGLTFITNARLLIDRINEVLNYPEIEAHTFPAPKDSTNGIEFDHFSAYWSKEEDRNISKITPVDEEVPSSSKIRPTISNITMNIKKGSLNAVVGRVGSGKSSFLLTLTGEMPKTVGDLRYKGSIAYVEQEPTIFAGTIRESILFGRPYRPDFYQRVVKDCNLESDLKLFKNGDLSQVGEKGVNLSGGQRARLALARAVYADADIYLLDDPLSAVDAKVAKSIYNDAISTLLKDKTVILATHQVHFVKNLENILVMDSGCIVASGSYEDIRKTYKDVDKVFPPTEENQEELPAEVKTQLPATTTGAIISSTNQDAKKKQEIATEQEAGVADNDDSSSGVISANTYFTYFKSMGNIWLWLLLLAVWLSNLLANIGFGRMLAAWASGELPRNTCLAVIGSLTGYIIIAYYVQYLIIYGMTIRASNQYHDRMLENIVRSPALFFDKNPVGRILNRFANDLGAMDIFLAMTVLDCIDVFGLVSSLLIALAVLFPWTLLVSFFLICCMALLVYSFLPAIRLTKIYELMSRSPFSSEFSSTLSGIIIIRSYKQIGFVTNRFFEYLNNNVKGSIMVNTVSRAFGFYVDLIYNLCSIGNIFIVISLGADIPPLAAFGLVLLLNILSALQYGMKQTMQTHLLMASPARIQSYFKNKPEAAIALPKDQEVKKSNWPNQAEIDFNHIYMKYRPDADHVLRDLTLNVKPGQKIGCVGRTGAGKSTIIQVLFRMVEVDRTQNPNTSLKIDGVDTIDLGLHLVRDSISIIPQTPFIFADTIRNNLDPLNHHTDERLWEVLADVNLKENVERLENKLYTDMTNAASVFSVGQKQLICLARALLKNSNILVLDEATANVDKQTDDFIQQKIMERFGHATIFTIAHRLSTIANYDRVLVLDKGRRMEFDEPYRLLVSEIGDNKITNEHGHFASMVLNTGPIASLDILKMAKEKYEQDRKKLA